MNLLRLSLIDKTNYGEVHHLNYSSIIARPITVHQRTLSE